MLIELILFIQKLFFKIKWGTKLTTKTKKKWIASAVKNKGALHKALDVPEGKKIPAKKLAKATKSNNPKIRKEAALAKTLKKMNKK